MLRVAYNVSVDEVRREFERIVAESPLWDRRVARLEVTDSGDVTMELRALVSAANSTDLWNLRCEVREKLISFIYVPPLTRPPTDA